MRLQALRNRRYKPCQEAVFAMHLLSMLSSFRETRCSRRNRTRCTCGDKLAQGDSTWHRLEHNRASNEGSIARMKQVGRVNGVDPLQWTSIVLLLTSGTEIGSSSDMAPWLVKGTETSSGTCAFNRTMSCCRFWITCRSSAQGSTRDKIGGL